MALALGALLGALTGLALALAQVKLVRIYANGKPEHIQQRAFDTIDPIEAHELPRSAAHFLDHRLHAAVSYFDKGATKHGTRTGRQGLS